MLVDFTSNQALGRPLRRDTAESRRLWSGLSVFDTEVGARAMATRFPSLGSFIAVLRIRPGATLRLERTTATQGHYTLWGDPADLLACIIDVLPR